ncbi:MAG: FcoT family thioesterase [Scytonematopsis contorta HA4267-MV1]|jgi:hypothetical protein|nr:FcoT family thioesterase [Scytonematopsis contorta HA4267-MV1]
MNINQEFTKVDNVSQNLLDEFLQPYKEHCKYLKKAQFQYPEQINSHEKSKTENQALWSIKADFLIPESCYIDSTGHFNSVEFNICYNQLFYTMIAHMVENKLLDVMKDWDLESYRRRQLSDFLIVKFSSAFKKQINSSDFQGTLSINKCSARGNLIILKTTCNFYNDAGGWAEGDVTIAILNEKQKDTVDSSQETVVA